MDIKSLDAAGLLADLDEVTEFLQRNSKDADIPYWLAKETDRGAFLSYTIRKLPATAEALIVRENSDILGFTFIQRDVFDSSVFGQPMGKQGFFIIRSDLAGKRRVREALVLGSQKRALEMSLKHMSARLSGRDSLIVHLLEDVGYRAMDVGVTLVRRPSSVKQEGIQGVSIGDFMEEDLEEVQKMSIGMYDQSRYYTDPSLEKSKTDELHRIWIKNDCSGRAQKVFVARINGRPAGYIACLYFDTVLETNSPPIADIDLLGVASWARGRGIGSALVRQAVNWFADHVSYITVKTQATNYSALQLYQKEGFRLEHTAITLHKKFREN